MFNWDKTIDADHMVRKLPTTIYWGVTGPLTVFVFLVFGGIPYIQQTEWWKNKKKQWKNEKKQWKEIEEILEGKGDFSYIV